VTPEATGTIYGLVDPRTHDVKYVGQTVKPIDVRLAGHLAAPAPLVRAWIEALAVEGHSPEIVPIRENVPAAELNAAEREEIRAHAERGDILNVAGNDAGNATRRKVSREEARRRRAEEEAMDRTWRQATWRQVADQLRAALGGPISPADIPIRDIPALVWDAYLAYREADRYLTDRDASLRFHAAYADIAGQTEPRTPEVEAAFLQRHTSQAGLERYVRAYCGAFSRVDQGDRWSSNDGAFGRGAEAYREQFTDPTHMARHLSLIAWASRCLDPWVAIAKEAGMGRKSPEFTEWISDDQAVREAVGLYQQVAPGWLGMPRQAWDTTLATHMLALGAAHIAGFVVPDRLQAQLQEKLTELARDRQATKEVCQLLQHINPKALNAVYGRDELAESDEALGLPPGTSVRVIRQVYGGDSHDPADRAAKLIQRHAGVFDTVALPDFAEWSGPRVAGIRVIAASFCGAGLFPDVEPAERDEFMEQVKSTWMPSRQGLEHLEELENAMVAPAVRATDATA
jgi:hypothetical protein